MSQKPIKHKYYSSYKVLIISPVTKGAYLQLNFEYFYDNGRDALMQYSPPLVQGTIIYDIYAFFVLLVFLWQIINFVFYSSLPARKRVVYTW